MENTFKMYNLSKVLDLPKTIELPTNMYSMKRVFTLPQDVGTIYSQDKEVVKVEETKEDKMYRMNKVIELPTDINSASNMYSMSKTFTLPEGVGNSYYGNNNSLSSGNTKGDSKFEVLELRQKNVLNRLKLFQEKLNSLVQNPMFSSGTQGGQIDSGNIFNSALTAPEERKQLVNVIDEVKNQLKGVNQLGDIQRETVIPDFEQLKQWQGTIVKHLTALKTEVTAIAKDSQTTLTIMHEEDLKFRQQSILQVIEALQLLLKSREEAYNHRFEDCNSGSIEKHHADVITLIDGLHKELKKVLFKLSGPKLENYGVVHDVVIFSNPNQPPYSLLAVVKILEESGYKVLLSNSTHSSIDYVDPVLQKLFSSQSYRERNKHNVALTLIWKEQQIKSLMVNPIKLRSIEGESNILRYISRLLPSTSALNYESKGSFAQILNIDSWLDVLQTKLLHGSNREQQAVLKQLNAKLGSSKWISDGECGLVDIFGWSVILELRLKSSLPTHISTWFKNVANLCGLANFNGKE